MVGRIVCRSPGGHPMGFQIAVNAGATAVLTDKPKWLNDQIKKGALCLPKLQAY